MELDVSRGKHFGACGDVDPPAFLCGDGVAIAEHDTFNGPRGDLGLMLLDADVRRDAKRPEVSEIGRGAKPDLILRHVVSVG